MSRTKVLVIDAQKQEIREATVETLEDMQAIVEGLIERAQILKTGDEIYVNEEGLFKNFEYGFSVAGAFSRFYLGSGYVIGEADDEGDNTDVKISIENLKKLVTFRTLEDRV